MERAPAMRSWPFAAGGELRKGKALVIADHSIFINDMMLPAPEMDNHNFTFARNCIRWLTDDGRRKHVCFVEDGRVVTAFDISFKETLPPPVPIPSEADLIDKGNEILASLDENDSFNALINERIKDRVASVWGLILVVLTFLLSVWGFWRLNQNRHRIQRQEPLLAMCLAGQGLRRNLVDRRNEEMLRQNNYWEAAHQLARQWFASILEPTTHAGSVDQRFATPPRITARGTWWRRRRMRTQVLRLWRVAAGRTPEKVSAAALARLEEELRVVRAALASGTLQLS
jgi:hypothetical protein